MKTSMIVATSLMCCLAAGLSTSAWSDEDLDAVLENVSISSEAQNTVKTDQDSNYLPCASKTPGQDCPDSSRDDVNANTNAAVTLQQSIMSSRQQNVTINGAAVTEAPHANILVNGF